MSLMNYGFTKKKVLDDDCQVVAIKKRQEGEMVSSPGKSLKKKSHSKSPTPKKSPKKTIHKEKVEEKHSPPKSSKLSKKSSPESSSKLNSKKYSPKGTSKTKILSDDSPKGTTVKKSTDVLSGNAKKLTDNTLPYMRIKMIMKSCPDVDSVNHESLHVVTKATELFIQHLATESIRTSNADSLDYEALSSIVHNSSNLEFLKETIPKKITWAECQRLIEAKKTNDNGDVI